MGFVLKQGSLSFIISGFALILGVINNIFIYPRFLNTHGFLQSIISLTNILIPFSLWGLNIVMNKYHVLFSHDNYKGFINFILKWLIYAFAAFTIVFWVILPIAFSFIGDDNTTINNFNAFKFSVYIIVLLGAFRIISISYSTIFRKIVIPNFLVRIVYNKLFLPAIVVVSGIYALSKYNTLVLLIAFNILLVGLILLYLFRNNWLNNPFIKLNIDSEKRKEIFKFGTYGILNDTGVLLAFSIDILIVNALLGNKSAGVYAIFLFLANVVRLPIDSLGSLLSPMISKFMSENDRSSINQYYKRTTIGIFSLMLAIFIFIFSSMTDILAIMKLEYIDLARIIFLLISAGILVNGLTYLNGVILVQSGYYKWNLIFIIFLAVINIFASYVFIEYIFQGELKAAGAACGTAVSIFMYNLLKTSFVYYKLGYQPFSYKSLIVIGLALLNLVILYYLNISINPIINMLITGGLVTLGFILPIYLLKISEDVNVIFDSIINKLSTKA